jgi:prepilin-type N-terminal cleavage/methylation domain-containing protein
MNAMHTLTDNTFGQRSSGFSMVELMVAMTISLLLMAGVVQIFSGSKASYTMQEGTSRLQENARFALGRLSHDIGAAGYLGCLDSAKPARPFTNDLLDQTAASGYDFATPLFGSEGTGANGSDTISISRASATTGIRLTAPMDTPISDLQLDATDNAYQSLAQFDILAVDDCGTASVFRIPVSTASVLLPSVGLVIAIAIVGILASIAYPSYVNQMRQAKRADCEGALLQLASVMERDFSRNNQYQNLIGAGNFSNQCPIDGGTASYNLGYQALTATTYTLQATPVGPQAGDPCGTLTLSNALQKGQSSGTLAECWQ